jgi:hypothetical protein
MMTADDMLDGKLGVVGVVNIVGPGVRDALIHVEIEVIQLRI